MKISNQAIATIENPGLVLQRRKAAPVPAQINLTDLSYLRFLSVLTNQPMKKVASMFSRGEE